jgi:ATP phosphoribosyltransferase regulatory subunit
MSFETRVLREDEKATYRLRELYRRHGYSHYRVSKFEEYDLYAKNKNFLVSENLLTFTDTNGKLMALKPDVTLSIIKNVVADVKNSYKLYYDEHVYRTTSSGDGFREITQTGLESIGNIDVFAESEVIMLAMKSLFSVSEDYLLDISHMRLLEGLVENMGVDTTGMSEIFALVGSKNVSGIRSLCHRYTIDTDSVDKLCELTAMYQPIGKALHILSPYVSGEKMQAAFDELLEIYEAMREYGLDDKLYLDLSIVNDMNYYDGVIFKGFVNGIPDSILSGGRYDRLMERFGKKMGAVGFAVYLDKLERFGGVVDDFDVDYMLVYDNDVSSSDIIAAAKKLGRDGNSVRASSAADAGVRYRKLVKLSKGGIETLEENY